MMPEVSVIVPVYNAAKPWKDEKTTLHRCIDSILSQDMPDLELILVDDGSKDESPRILDEYAAADERVRVLHKENAGVSDTRNKGIALAQGKYIQFVDADDWLDREAVKLLLRSMKDNDADMVIADFYRVIDDRTAVKGDIENETVLYRTEYADYMMKNPADFYYGVLWNKLYKADIIREHQLQMDPKISWCEDFVFNLEYVTHCSRIAVLHVPIYYYVKTEGSLVNQNISISSTVRMKLSMIEYYNQFYRDILPESEYQLRMPAIYAFLFSAAGDGSAYPFDPSTKKLGTERINAALREDAEQNPYTRLYYEQKRLDRQLETAADAFDLELKDARLVLYGMTVGSEWDFREAADFTGLTVTQIAASAEKLVRKKILNRNWEGLRIVYDWGEASQPVRQAIRLALADYEKEEGRR